MLERVFAAAGIFLSAAVPAAGEPWVGEAGITENIASLRSRDARRAQHETPPPHNKPVLRPDRRGLPRNPRTSADTLTVTGPQAPAVTPFAPQVPGLSFTGATLTDCNSYPPDTMGTVGPTQFIVALNGRIRSFNKSTGVADGVLNADMDVFFASVMTPASGNYTTDPRIRYDRLSGRWFVIMIDVPGGKASQPNRVLIAVSSGSSISNTSSFTFFYFRHDTVSPAGDTGYFADYPTLGIDNNALYIGDNVFTSNGAFVGTSGFVVRKSSILGAGPIVVTAFRGLVPNSSADGPYSPQGVDNYDPAATEGYFIGSSNTAFNELVVRRVSTPGGTPSISPNIIITIPATAAPITVPHLGNTGGSKGYLDALDDRIFAAHIRNGQLWTAHNIEVDNTGTANASGNRNGSRWYQIQNLGGSPGVAQWGTVYDASVTSKPKSCWIPTIMVSGQGHAAMGFSTAGAANYVNAATCGRLAGDAPGTMQPPVEYTASNTAYNPPGDRGSSSGRRWGDYSFTSLDPDDDMTMWTIQEFCDSSNSYGVRVVKLGAPPPATPAACSPAIIAGGQTSVNVTVTGTQAAGSGFFDPGAGFANRLAAAVSGGVTVNSVTFTSATSVTLNLDTTGATGGAKTLTVTNPDGQSATSGSGILTIDPATQTPTLTNPAANSFTNSPVSVSFSLPEAALAASVKLIFSGVADRTLTLAATQESAGTHNFTFNPANPTLSLEIAAITGGPTIPDGYYTLTLSYQDQAGNSAATTTHANVCIDTTAPVVTPPANVTALPTSSAGAVVTYPAATAVDAVGVVLITYSQNSGTSFPIGTTTVTVTAWDASNNNGTASFTVTVSPLTPVQSWRDLHFHTIANSGIAADTADPNNNGIVNLVEYALGGDPSGSTTGTAILPRPGRSATDTLQIQFTRYPDRSDLTLTAQAADSPAGPWTDLARSTAGAPFVLLVTGAAATETGTGSTRQVTVADLYPVTDPARLRRFMRLEIANIGGF